MLNIYHRTNLDFPKIPWFSLPDIWCWFPICWLEIVTTDMVAIHQLRIPAAWSGAARNNYLLSAQQQPGLSGPSAATLYIIELQSQSVSSGGLGFWHWYYPEKVPLPSKLPTPYRKDQVLLRILSTFYYIWMIDKDLHWRFIIFGEDGEIVFKKPPVICLSYCEYCCPSWTTRSSLAWRGKGKVGPLRVFGLIK